MTHFRLAPLAVALAGMLAVLPTAQSQVPSKGDLDIYASSDKEKNPTIMLVVEASTFTNESDAIGEKGADVQIVSIAKWSNTVPKYKRLTYYNSLSNVGGVDQSKLFPTRLTRMKDAIFYLMDTPGLLPDDYQIGLTRYSGGPIVKDNPTLNGDSHTANVVIAADKLGPVITDYDYIQDGAGNYVKIGEDFIQISYDRYAQNLINKNDFYFLPTGNWGKRLDNGRIYYTKNIQGAYVPNDRGAFVKDNNSETIRSVNAQDFVDLGNAKTNVYSQTCSGRDSAGNKITNSQRCLIKTYVAQMCDADVFCTGDAPMAFAYTEAGAYMMGTKTATLVNKPNTIKPEDIIYPRALRKARNSNTWEYCPPEDRQLFQYKENSITRFRSECPDGTKILPDGTERNYWIPVNSKVLADRNWASNPVKPTEIEGLTEQQRSFDLLWNPLQTLDGGNYGAPHGVTLKVNKTSPTTFAFREWDFTKDSLQKRNPTETSPGTEDEYEYWLDNTADPQSGLYPIVRYQPFRNRVGTDGSRVDWQYCAYDKAKLINFGVASFKVTCQEGDWIRVNRANIGDVVLNNNKVEWTCGLTRNCSIATNTPAGIGARLAYNISNGNWFPEATKHYFPPDDIRGGWQYYYDADWVSNIAMPPTLLGVSGFRASSIRNSPPGVRGDKSYTYKEPNYSECSMFTQVDSSGNNVSGATTVENAILFLTAGWPAMSDLTYSAPTSEMNMSLSSANATVSNPMGGGILCPSSGSKLTAAAPANNYWCEMGEYSKRLRMAEYEPGKRYQNPANAVVKTGVFLFSSNKNTQAMTGAGGVIGQQGGVPIYDCSKAESDSIKNACLLGQYGAGYGEGGFFLSTSRKGDESYQELADAIIKMANNLNDDMGLVPTGAPVVPRDTFNRDRLLGYGYLSLMRPSMGKTAQWQGNLRKYKQVNGLYLGKDNKSPFATTASALLAPTSQDYWHSGDPYTSSKLEGGVFENIKMPMTATTDTPRKVYLSSNTAGTELTKLSPDDAAIRGVSVTGVDDQNVLRRLLLNYMGYKIGSFTDNTSTDDITATFSSGSNKSMGGVFHSTPIALTSKLTLKDGEYEPTKQYILFGAMDNALRVVDNATGEEVFSYFPREVLGTNGQYKAITPELSTSDGEVAPSFGVDGPWEAYAKYGPVTKNNKEDYTELEAKQLYAYGGARLGAKAYYGLDLTGIHNSGFKPKQLFTIDDTMSKFNRLGFSWAKPVITKIRWQGQPKLVVIFTGGYDTHYDKTDADRLKAYNDGDVATKDAIDKGTKGNAVYVVDAETGAPLIIASNNAAATGVGGASNSDGAMVNVSATASTYNDVTSTIPVLNSNLKYSITGSVKTLDRDADELTDHIYFADLNGQVFRMDINNSASKPSKEINGKTVAASNPSARVIRLADLKTTNAKIGPRLYETPIVTIHENADRERFAVVSVASGDRSNPLWEPISTDATNHVYAIYDKDVGRVNLFNTATLLTQNVTSTELADKPKDQSDSNYTKKGWKAPLNQFTTFVKAADGSLTQTNTTNNAVKALGPMSAVGGKLYIATYNPADGLGDPTGCTAEVKGSSEAIQFCLPFGFCDDKKTAEDQAQRIRIGKGIQGIAFGGKGTDPNNISIITTSPPPASGGGTGGTTGGGSNTGNNPSAPNFKGSYSFRPFLRPMAWFDLQSQKEGTTTATTPPASSGGAGGTP